METINDIVRKVAEEMLNTSMQDITAEIINKWAVRIGDAATGEKSSQVGNAAKMRSELKCIDNIAKYLEAGTIRDVLHAYRNIQDRVRIALSKPSRNCDLYATEPEAYQAYLTSMKNETKENYMYFEPWLFAVAKGNAK